MSIDQEITGAEIILQALKDQEVDTIFGYPGGAVLPIYDAIFGQNFLKHVLVRQEAGAVHAAEGYARSSGKVGVLLVTSGPGVTNVVTGLTDALMDSIPIVCISGQVPSHLIGTDAFQECDTTGITRPCTKHNYLVKDVSKLSETIHEAFEIARSGRPGPVLIDIPKDVQFAKAKYTPKSEVTFKPHRIKSGSSEIDSEFIEKLIEHIQQSKKPIFYVGGGCLNSGPQASQELMKLVQKTNIPGANFKLKIRNFEGYRNYDKSEFDSVSPLYEGDEGRLRDTYESLYELAPFTDPSTYKSYEDLKRKLIEVLGEEEVNGDASVSNHTTVNEPSAPGLDKVEDEIPGLGSEAAAPEPAPVEESGGSDDDDTLSYFAQLAQQ
jgi:TPP-dependent 2-oxoacid decarboxylase